MSDEVERHISLSEEVRVSIDVLKDGLGHLQLIDGANDNYFVPLQLLSGGLERLLKTLICYQTLASEGRFPNPQELRETHDLVRLLHQVIDREWPQEYLSRPAAQQDLDFLHRDQTFRKVLETLSDFGKGPVRYRNLDLVRGVDSGVEAPDRMWMRIELDVLEDLGQLERIRVPGQLGAIYRDVNRVLVATLERSIRALCRLFTWGDLGEDAKRQTGLIAEFLGLMDDDLGMRGYDHDRHQG